MAMRQAEVYAQVVRTAAASGLALAALVLGGCGNDEFEDEDFSNGVCDAREPSAFIDAISREWYLYPEQLPELELPEGSAQPFLRQLIQSVDLAPESPAVNAADRFSFITTRARFASSTSGDFVGLGTFSQLEGPEDARRLRLLDVLGSGPREESTPASEAGLRRGDLIVAIGGVPLQNVLDQRRPDVSEYGAINEAFGPATAGSVVELGLERADGTTYEARLIRRAVDTNEVPVAEILGDTDPIGYMVFRDFTSSSPDQLSRAIGVFADGSVSKVIVDLRYNSGGFLSVATFFASLLAGPTHDGEVFFRSTLNPNKDAEQGFSATLSRNPVCPIGTCRASIRPLLRIDALVFITTGATASASELLINGLRPFVDVRVVGSRSFGKPVGFFPFEHEDCDQVYAPVTFKSVNANGNGDFFGGLPVDCPAPDGTARVFGDPEEASLSTALTLLRTGRCPVRSSLRADLDAPAPRSYQELRTWH